MEIPTNLAHIQSVDWARIPWDTLLVEQTGAKIPVKPLFADPVGPMVF
ncbi:hypothetical protein [Nocardia sp. NPDC051981]